MAALSEFQSVQENFFVELNIDGSYTRFSDYDIPETIDGDSYTALGSLLGITNTSTELRATNQQLSIAISGIPATNLALVNNANIKGSIVTVWRKLYNPTTAIGLSLTEANPQIKFKGLVTNFSIVEKWSQSPSFTLNFEVQSIIGQLLVKTTGRRTNPNDEKKFFPSDISFDRVPSLRNSNFNFGAPDTMPKVGTK
jgi:hypothetical protein